VQFTPLLSYLFSIKPKYPTQHPFLEYHQPIFLPQCERPSFTPMKKQQAKVYVLIFIFLDSKFNAGRVARNKHDHVLSLASKSTCSWSYTMEFSGGVCNRNNFLGLTVLD
jgi:hypothetical protein